MLPLPDSTAATGMKLSTRWAHDVYGSVRVVKAARRAVCSGGCSFRAARGASWFTLGARAAPRRLLMRIRHARVCARAVLASGWWLGSVLCSALVSLSLLRLLLVTVRCRCCDGDPLPPELPHTMI